MLTSTLRAVGGSVMLAIPKPVLESLGLSANEKVGLRIDAGVLVVEPRPRTRFTLAELLAQCDANAPESGHDLEWEQTEPVGREII